MYTYRFKLLTDNGIEFHQFTSDSPWHAKDQARLYGQILDWYRI